MGLREIRFRHVASASSIRPLLLPASVQSLLPTVGISKRRVRQVDTVLLIQDQRQQRAQELAFNARPLPGAEFCRGYVQSWAKGEAISERSAQRIFHADRILKAGYAEKPTTEAP